MLIDELRDRYRTSLTKTCALFGMSRSLYRYQSVARDSSALLMRIKEITATRVHYGYRRVHVVLRREGWRDNCKRVYRLYRAEGLSLRHKRPRRNKSARLRQPKHIVTAINEIWSMDFLWSTRKSQAQTGGDRRLAFIYPAYSDPIESGSGLHDEVARFRPN